MTGIHLAIAGAIVFVTSLICGLLVVIKTRINSLRLLWVLFNIAVSLWGLGLFIGFSTKDAETTLFWSRFLNLSAVWIPIFFFHFVVIFTRRSKKTELLVYYLVTVVYFSTSIIVPRWFIPSVSNKLSFIYYPDSGFLYYFFPVLFISLLGYALLLLFIELKKSTGTRANQIRYLILGYLIGFSGGSTTFPMVFNIPVPPIGSYIFPAHVLLSTYAIIKFRLMDVRVAVTRAGISFFVYAFALGVPFWVGYRLIGTRYWYAPIGLMAALALVGPFIYNVLTNKAENVILAEQKRYQKILRRASNRMKHIHNLDKLLELIVEVISKTVKVNYVAAYLNEPENNRYVLKAFRDSETKIPKEFKEDHPLIKYLKDKDEPFIYEEMSEEIKKSLGEAGEIGLIVPSGDELSLVGFLVMGHKSNGSLFSEGDINTFSIISNQASTQVINCLHTENAKKEQERTYNAERLSTIGAMATGVAHQFRNRLNNFVTIAGTMEFDIEDILELAKNAKEKGLDFSGFIDSVQLAAKRIQKCAHQTTDIIQGVIDFSSMEKQDPAPVEFKLSGFLGPCKSMLSVKHGLPEGETIPLTSEFGENDLVFGDRVLLFKAVYNAIDNSYEAIEEKLDTYLVGKEKEDFVPEIKIGIEQKEKVSLIKISDNGIGIKEEDKKKVFAPYYTSKVSSKPSHSGVGMYSVKRSIEELLGGRVWIESEYTKGATFYIEIPRKPKV